jgi:hypothetical protein
MVFYPVADGFAHHAEAGMHFGPARLPGRYCFSSLTRARRAQVAGAEEE